MQRLANNGWNMLMPSRDTNCGGFKMQLENFISLLLTDISPTRLRTIVRDLHGYYKSN